MKNKLNFNKLYTAENIISANLDMQSNRRMLKDKFGLLNPEYSNLISLKFLKNYSSWDEDKKNNFFVILGGKGYFNKIKNFFELKAKEINHENIV